MARRDFGPTIAATVAATWLVAGCWVTNPNFGADESDSATGGDSAGTTRGSTSATSASTLVLISSTGAGESEGTAVTAATSTSGGDTLAVTAGDASTGTTGAELSACPLGTVQASTPIADAIATTMTASANMSPACAWNNAVADCRDYQATTGFIRMARDPIEGTSWFLFRFDQNQVVAAIPEEATPLGLSVGITYWEQLAVPATDKVLELALLDIADADWNPAEATFRQKASGVPWSGGDLGPTLGTPLAKVDVNAATVPPTELDESGDQYHAHVRSEVFPADPVAAWVFKGQDPTFSLHIIAPDPASFTGETFGVKAIAAGWPVPSLHVEYCMPAP